jgi:hypothetical protein
MTLNDCIGRTCHLSIEILGTPWLRRNKVIPSNVEQVKGAAQLDATVGHILAVLEDGLLHGGDSTS